MLASIYSVSIYLNNVGFYYSSSLHIFYSELALEWNLSMCTNLKFTDCANLACTLGPFWKFIDWIGQSTDGSDSQKRWNIHTCTVNFMNGRSRPRN